LRGRIDRRAEAVRRHRETIFDERDAPAREDRRKSGEDLYFRCPYQANVIKTFEQTSITMGKSAGGIVSDMAESVCWR
jgi:hypothetical protein